MVKEVSSEIILEEVRKRRLPKKAILSVITIALIVVSSLAVWWFMFRIIRPSARTIWVPGNYSTIQGAIDGANPGDTIRVRAGTYYENPVVNKNNLTLVGENMEVTIIDGSGVGDVVTVKANNVIISGFTKRNSGRKEGWRGYGFYALDSGISVQWSSGNIIVGNNLMDNFCGITLKNSSDNRIFHNNFINNRALASITEGYMNTWDDGYPSGGNYWSDHTWIDEKSGPDQNEPGSDGISDTLKDLRANNIDRYPLMNPWKQSP